MLGVWWAGHIVSQCAWHPAAEYSKFWYASMNTTTGQGQKFSKIALQQLCLALIPASYLHWGYIGLTMAIVSIVYFQLQIETFVFLSQKMRDGVIHCPFPIAGARRAYLPLHAAPPLTATNSH